MHRQNKARQDHGCFSRYPNRAAARYRKKSFGWYKNVIASNGEDLNGYRRMLPFPDVEKDSIFIAFFGKR